MERQLNNSIMFGVHQNGNTNRNY